MYDSIYAADVVHTARTSEIDRHNELVRSLRESDAISTPRPLTAVVAAWVTRLRGTDHRHGARRRTHGTVVAH